MKKAQEPLSSYTPRVPRSAKRRRGKRIRQFLGLIVLTVFGILFYDGYSALSFFKKVNQQNTANAAQVVDVWKGTSRVNILLLGVDNRNHDVNPRSDSMIVASIDPVTKTAALISVMRDSFVSIPGYGKDKINAAYADGGGPLAVQTVKNFLNIPIQYYMVTDFQGFEGVIDSVGGVDFNVEKDMDYTDDGVYDIHLKKGMQHLDGKHALMYVRFRHDDTSDFTRTERQRNLLKALSTKLKSPATALRLPSILQAAENYVQTNIQPQDALRLAYLMSTIDTAHITPLQIPPSNGLTISNNNQAGDVLIPDVATSRAAVEQLFQQQAGAAGTGADKQPVSSSTSGSSAGNKSNANLPGSTSQASSNKLMQTATVQGSAVNVRKEPSTSFEVIASVTFGDTVTVLGTEPGGWKYVQLSNGIKGYIAAQFLRFQ